MPPLTRIVKILLITNIAIFALDALLNINLIEPFGLRNFSTASFAPYQMVTHMFLHGNFTHLLVNMFSLFMFGPMVEIALGERKFMVFYGICGIGAALLFMAVDYWELSHLHQDVGLLIANPNADQLLQFLGEYAPQLKSQPAMIEFINEFSSQPHNLVYHQQTIELANQLLVSKANAPMVGASGAIFGVLLAFGYLFPNIQLMPLFPPIPLKAKYYIGFYALIELFYGIRQTSDSNVAHFAHIGGMLFAYIVLKFWKMESNKHL
jgi:membrane associated rhomboid family serine protease